MTEEAGNLILFRGGEKIPVEKEESIFSFMPVSIKHIQFVQSLSGVEKIRPITNQVYKINTSSVERDDLMNRLRTGPDPSIVHHAYRPAQSQGTMYYLTDKFTVWFSEENKWEEIEQLLDDYKLRVLKTYDQEKRCYLLQVTSQSGGNPLKLCNQLVKESCVITAEPNLVNRFQSQYRPNDPLYSHQWHLKAQDGPQVRAGASVEAETAWDITVGNRNIVIAVIDDGFDLGHPDFNVAGKIVFPKDYVDGDSNPFPESENEDYHGTPCAGVALAEMNGRGVVGIASGCSFMPIRFPLGADDDLLNEIFLQAAQYADVISCSWGPPPAYAPLSTLVDETLKKISGSGGPRGKGCVICFAAGNYNAPVRDDQNLNGVRWLDSRRNIIRTTTSKILNGFASHPSVIAVAASTSLNRHAAYSNWGKEISVCAPSNNFHPLDPQAYVPGLGIWTTDNDRYGEGFTPNSWYTGNFGGTSSATPLVAGVAALVLSVNQNLSAKEVRDVLQETSDKIVDTNQDLILNVNKGNYDGNGHSEWFGHGKVNAAKAVNKAKNSLANPSVPPVIGSAGPGSEPGGSE